MTDVTDEIQRAGRFAEIASYQRFAYACAALLLVSGVFHGFVFLVDGGSWEGPVSWRKPIVFGLSFGVTLATLTWIVGLAEDPEDHRVGRSWGRCRWRRSSRSS